MIKEIFLKAGLLISLLLLYGCQSTPQADALRLAKPANLSLGHQIQGVPFYPQQQFYCGPTTLAEVFEFYGKSIDVNEIAPKLFIPGRDGSLQLEMISATRQYGFLPYAGRGTLEKILYLIDDDIPVIVLQNNSISLFPMWHYAVVTGFNMDLHELRLHTGLTKNHVMSFDLFEKTWQRGNYWLLAPLPVGKTNRNLDQFKYISAAFDMLSTGKEQQGVENLIAAVDQWPEQWLAYFLLANHFREFDQKKAIFWFDKGLAAGKSQQPYLNNYSYVLSKAGCHSEAKKVMRYALSIFPGDKTLLETSSNIADKNSATNYICPESVL